MCDIINTHYLHIPHLTLQTRNIIGFGAVAQNLPKCDKLILSLLSKIIQHDIIKSTVPTTPQAIGVYVTSFLGHLSLEKSMFEKLWIEIVA